MPAVLACDRAIARQAGTGKCGGQKLSPARRWSMCTYDTCATKWARRVCSGGCRSHMRLTSEVHASTEWVLGEQEATGPAAWCSLSRPTGGVEERRQTGAFNKVVRASMQCLSRKLHVLRAAGRGRWRVWVTTLGHHQPLTHTGGTCRRYTTRSRSADGRHSRDGAGPGLAASVYPRLQALCIVWGCNGPR